MAIVTLRLSDSIIQKLDTNAHILHMSRSDYIKKAIFAMNHDTQEYERKQRLQAASKLVRQESMKINAEFAAIEHDPEA